MSIAESNRSVRRGENKKPRHIGESASKGGASGVQKKEKRQRGRAGGNAWERKRELCEGTRLKRIEQSRAKRSYFT